ncbi:2-oxo-tetronate isomerase [Sphingobium vermicomposti]|uniref:Hydroxypyruvate isomerase n=1 Tax=Sphingobium vermicomposti TaxID=529005 RepID=A0A846MCQ3_9SPHN|nr:2-oxo-tetronate isomerase [Sphingobium vermicomposti]NIJ15555.1 hydroxypyruvate isomerase [Sphingobium vermicomposti]
MIKLAANLSMMFQDLPFLDRFDAAAEAGFSGVEFMFPYDHGAGEVAERGRRCGLEIALFNLPAGDWAGGERGIAALPGRVEEFRAGVAKGLDYANALGCPRLHLMAGKASASTECRAVLLDNIAYAADLAAADNVEILIEPINTRVDIPGYFYGTTAEALSVIDGAGRANVRLQYDIYHMQIMEGDLARMIERLLPRIGHMQLADNPGRAEPGTGEINYPWLLSHIDALGYAGWIGCEYRPAGDTKAGLGWARDYLNSGRG